MAVQEKTDELQLQNQRLEQANENVELLSRIGRDITSKLTIVDIIETVYENVNALMDAAVFGIGIVNEELHRIEFPATKENGQTLPPFFYNLDDDSRLAVRCFKHKEEIVIGDFARERERWVTGRVAPVAGKSTAATTRTSQRSPTSGRCPAKASQAASARSSAAAAASDKVSLACGAPDGALSTAAARPTRHRAS